MKTFFLTLFGLLGAIAAFNLLVDPARHWRGAPDSISLSWGEGDCWEFSNPDERLFRRLHLQKAERPHLVLMGSSRLLYTSGHEFKDSVNVFNASLSQASAEDFLALWQLLRNEAKVPKKLILVVDPWIFNSGHRTFFWKTNEHLVRQFEGQKGKSDGLGFLLRKQSDLVDLISFETLKTAYFSLRAGTMAASGRMLNPQSPDWGKKDCFRPDGGVNLSNEKLRPLTTQAIREIAKQYAAGTPYGLENWKVDDSSLASLSALIKQAKQLGVEVLVVAFPYHPLVLEILAHRKGYSPIVPQYRDALAHLQPSYCDVLDPQTAGCTENDFMDASHLLPSCVEKVIGHCAKKAGWRDVLKQ